MKYFIPLQNIEVDELPHAGGKAFNLSILKKKSFPVPEGFCLTGRLYEEALSDYLTDFYLLPLMEQKKRLPHIKSFILNYKFSPDFIDEVQNLISCHDGTFVVRSSCTMEDSCNYSFAGIYSSVLDVKLSSWDITESIKSVWSSFWSDEAFIYREERHISHRINMAVIIQKQIMPEISGVIFTCNPLTGHDEMVLNLTFSRIDELVSGKNMPDMLVINKKTPWNIKTGKIKLNEHVLEKLLNISCNIEDIFHAPQDIEWAYFNEEIYILQSRPVTYSSRMKWSRTPLIDFLPDILTPLSADFFGNYIQESLLSFHKELGIEIPDGSLVLNYKGRIYINEYIYGMVWEKLYDRSLFYSYFHSIWNMLPFLSLKLEEYRKKVKTLIDTIDKSDELWSVFSDIKNIMYREDITFHTGYMYQLLNDYYKLLLPEGMAEYKTYFQDFKPLDITLENYTFNKDLANISSEESVKEYIKNVSSEESVKEYIKINIPEILMNFIDKYGHWTDMPLELYRKRYREDYKHILGIISTSEQEDVRLAREDNKIEYKIIENKKIIEEIKKKYEKYATYVMVKHFNELIDWLIYLSDEREKHRKYTLLLTEGLRKLFLNMGDNLLKKGFLSKKEDIFFLNIKEIEILDSLDRYEEYWIEHINNIMKEYEILKDKIFPMEFTGSIPREVKGFSRKDICGMKLKGEVLHRGIVNGSARVILEPQELGNFHRGEILVVPGCEPCWSAVFPMARGIISETGGVLSHAAILAREYNIPGISGIFGATKTIKTGDNILLNGDEGWILIKEI